MRRDPRSRKAVCEIKATDLRVPPDGITVVMPAGNSGQKSFVVRHRCPFHFGQQ
jgi:hypothetical protein